MRVKFNDDSEYEITQKSIVQGNELKMILKAAELEVVEKIRVSENIETITEMDENTEKIYSGYTSIKDLIIKPDLESLNTNYYINITLEKNEYLNKISELQKSINEKNTLIEEQQLQIDSTAADCAIIMDIIDELMCSVIPTCIGE